MKKLISPSANSPKRNLGLLILVFINFLLISLLIWQYCSIHSHVTNEIQKLGDEQDYSPGLTQIRDFYRPLVHPLRLIEIAGESKDLKELKDAISVIIQQKKNDALIESASFYLRRLNDGSWTSLFGNEAFKAGSLMKVPIMITYLKKEEENPGILQKKLFYDQPPGVIPGQTVENKAIKPGNSYRVSDLLFYMIADSDNNATYLLMKYIDIPGFQKLFTDLGLQRPDVSDINYSLCANDYSKFMRVLYSASYLSDQYSEYALNLLTQCKFRKGLAKHLPASTIIAHKFGEQAEGNMSELSESGIIYHGNDAYLITVMTKGNDFDQLAEVISEISRDVNQRMKY